MVPLSKSRPKRATSAPPSPAFSACSYVLWNSNSSSQISIQSFDLTSACKYVVLCLMISTASKTISSTICFAGWISVTMALTWVVSGIQWNAISEW